MIFVGTKYNGNIFIFHPGIHYWEQHFMQSDVVTASRYELVPSTIPSEVTTKTISKEQVSHYLIPSISTSIRGQVSKNTFIQPEITLAIVRGDIAWNFGISFQFGEFGE